MTKQKPRKEKQAKQFRQNASSINKAFYEGMGIAPPSVPSKTESKRKLDAAVRSAKAENSARVSAADSKEQARILAAQQMKFAGLGGAKANRAQRK